MCYWLIEETNAADYYERTKFDLNTKTTIALQRRYLPCFNLNLRSYGQLFVLVFSRIALNYFLYLILDFCICLIIKFKYVNRIKW